MDGLNEASENLIMEMDTSIIANKMLDAFNRYRETGDAADVENARRFAAFLKVDSRSFPALFKAQARSAVTAHTDA